MLRNRALQVKMVKTNDADNAPEETPVHTVDPEQIAKIATDYTMKTIGFIGAAIAANKVISTICEIAVVTAKAKIK